MSTISNGLQPILKRRSFLENEASNIDEELEFLDKKMPTNNLIITPHKEFQGILTKIKSDKPNIIVTNKKKPKMDINQMIELQSTSGLIAQERCYEFSQFPNDLLISSYRTSHDKSNTTIDLTINQNLNENTIQYPKKLRASEDLLLNILPDTSLIPLNQDQLKDQFSLSNKSSPKISSRKSEAFCNMTSNNFLNNDMFYTEGKFLKDLLKSSKENNLDSLFEALTLCQGAKMSLPSEKPLTSNFENKHQPELKNLETRSREEEIIMEFAINCGYAFEKAEPQENPTQFYTKMKGNRLVYNVFGINEFSNEKKSFSVVLKSPIKDSEVFLLCKGQEDYMRSRLFVEKQDEESLEAVLKEMHMNGLKPVIYAKKLLPEFEAATYINKIRNLKSSLINQTEEMTNLALELETDMSLLCIIGLKDELNEGIDDLLSFSERAGINVWMLTGDSKENALSVASSIGLFNANYDKIKELVAEDHELLLLQLRQHLTEIKNIYMLNFFEIMDGSRKSIEQKKSLRKSFTKSIEDFFLKKIEQMKGITRENQSKFLDLKQRLTKSYLVINGKSLDLIYKDTYLKPHFVFLLSLFKKVIAYNLTPGQKYLLTETVQNGFADNPSVMAIGDGPNDCLMLQSAHIGIELLRDINKTPKLNAGDLQISNLGLLRDLMLCEGVNRLTLLENFVHLLFYKSFLIGWTLFLYNWFSAFAGTSAYSTIMVFLYSFLFLSFSLSFYAFFDRPVSQTLLKRFPALYKETLLKKRNLILRVLGKSLVEGILHGLLIFTICVYSLEETILNEGFNSDFTMLSFSLMTSVVFVPNFKILFLCLGHRNKYIIFPFIMTVFFYASFIFLGSHSMIGRPDWGVSFIFLMNNLNGVAPIIFNIWFSQLISFVYERYILKKVLYSSVKEKIADYEYLKKMNNEQIIKDLELPM